MTKTIYVILNDCWESDPENIKAFSNIDDARKFFRQFILDNYWQPGAEWPDLNHKNLDDAVEQGGFADDLRCNFVNIQEVEFEE